MSDTIVWIELGEQLLAQHAAWKRERTRHHVDSAKLRRKVGKAIAELSSTIERGLSRADDEGRAAAEAFTSVAGAPAKCGVDELAGAATMIGSREPDNVYDFGELLLREHGPRVCLRVLARMWRQRTNYSGNAVWLNAIADDNGSAYDASVSYAKARMATFLWVRRETMTEAQLEELCDEARAMWPDLAPQARAPVAIASGLDDLADEAARAALDAEPPPYPHYPLRNLAPHVGDLELVGALNDGAVPGLPILVKHGLDALPLYERVLAGKATSYQRTEALKHLCNVRGPRVAALMARDAEKATMKPLVRLYFSEYPELLEDIEPEDDKHGSRLAKLRRALEREAARRAKEVAAAAAAKEKATPKKATPKKATQKKATQKKATPKKAAKKPTGKAAE